MKPVLLGVAALAVLAGIAAAPRLTEAVGGGEQFPKPPPVVLQLDGAEVSLAPWTTCWANYCADGAPAPPELLISVGRRDTVDFSFAKSGWDFSAGYTELDTDCPHRWYAPAEKAGARTFRLAPVGPAGRYQVDVQGAGPQGDVITSFVWETATDAAVPASTSSLSVLADHDGRLDSYGVALGIDDLPGTHQEARASVKVTSAEGESVVLPVSLEANDAAGDGCHERGNLFFRAPDAVGRRAVALGGEGPFAYEVTLHLDDTTYVGRSMWPTDEDPDIAPGTELTWTPALPAYE